ncbi:MAG TPA: cysteine hydrolase family protein [Burkholderiaceae bacterium]
MKTALIVIDVQHHLFDEAPRPEDAAGVIERINALVAGAKQAGVPVAFVQHQSESGALMAGTRGWQFADALAVAPDDTIIAKTTPDSFLRTGLEGWLQQHGAQSVVICGGMTEFCIDTTTRRAAALGYPVTLAADAHTTHDKTHASAAMIRAHHNATLPDIGSFGVEIRAVAAGTIAWG